MDVIAFIALLVICTVCGYVFALENQRLRQQNGDLIDKFMFNKQPERIVKARIDAMSSRPDAVQTVVTGGMGDPVSVAERLAAEAAEDPMRPRPAPSHYGVR